MKVVFNSAISAQESLIIPVFADNLKVEGKLAKSTETYINKYLKKQHSFSGLNGQTLIVHDPKTGNKAVLLGVGTKGNSNKKSIRATASYLLRKLQEEGISQARFIAQDLDKQDNSLSANLADALLFETYDFNKYRTSTNKSFQINLNVQGAAQSEQKFKQLHELTKSIFLASDLVNETAEVLTPLNYAKIIQQELAPLGIKITVLDEDKMKSLGMNAALAVAKGSNNPPCMVVMEYNNSSSQKQPLSFVGKGLTFDSGGISLKPGNGMANMKMDMAGSAAVVGAMRALASRKAKTNVVSVVALAENMISSKAIRPGDIVKSMNGKTIQVDNTDAEGRLVLADAMTYIQRQHNPHTVIDLATLTGAAIGALGNNIAPVFSHNDSLCSKFNKASGATGEKTWRMPLDPEFTATMRRTPLADLTNLGSGAGSCTAAAFLAEFVEKDNKGKDKCKWMHIDMAGPGISARIRKGWGVLLLNEVVKENYEDRINKPKNNLKLKK